MKVEIDSPYNSGIGVKVSYSVRTHTKFISPRYTSSGCFSPCDAMMNLFFVEGGNSVEE